MIKTSTELQRCHIDKHCSPWTWNCFKKSHLITFDPVLHLNRSTQDVQSILDPQDGHAKHESVENDTFMLHLVCIHIHIHIYICTVLHNTSKHIHTHTHTQIHIQIHIQFFKLPPKVVHTRNVISIPNLSHVAKNPTQGIAASGGTPIFCPTLQISTPPPGRRCRVLSCHPQKHG